MSLYEFEPGIFWRWVGLTNGEGMAHLTAAVVTTDGLAMGIRGTAGRYLTPCSDAPPFQTPMGAPHPHQDACPPCFEQWARSQTLDLDHT